MDPFVAEIRVLPYTFAPRGWALCNGQLLPISQNTALFSLLGTMYGGDGRTTFALPDLRGRTPIHVGPSTTQGARFGEEAHTLVQSEMPAHTHVAEASLTNGDQAVPTGLVLAAALNQY